MGVRPLWTRERGALWVLDLDGVILPAPLAGSELRSPVDFSEAHADAASALAGVMDLPDPAPIRQRFAAGNRCFVARPAALPAAAPVAYGWLSYSREYVGELERTFRMREGDVYIWNCGTLPPYRGQGLYSTLLSVMLARLQAEGVPRVWIGAARDNQPSVRGIERAGFQLVLKMVYMRLLRLHSMWLTPVPAAPPGLVAAARRMVLSDRVQAGGRLGIGIG